MSITNSNTSKLILAFAIFIIATAVFLGVHQYVVDIDIATVPEPFVNIVTIVQGYFGTGALLFAVSYLRNMLGYFRNWLKLRKTGTTDYEIGRYYDTTIYYVGIIGVFVAALPAPFNWFALGIGAFIEIFTSEYKKIVPTPPST